MKLYRFSSPIQLQPLEENPNIRSEEGSLYYSSVDAKVKLREPNSWEDIATIKYVDDQEFGASNLQIDDLRNNDFMRFNQTTGKWQNVMSVYKAAPESEVWDEIISTNQDGFLDKSFLHYNIDMDGHTFYNLLDPQNPADAATKNYVDSQEFGASNIVITDASTYDLLHYNGTKWVNVCGLQIETNSLALSLTPSGIIQHAAQWAKASPGINDASKHLVEVYNTDLTIPSQHTGYIDNFAFPVTKFSGCRVDYRLKSIQSGDVRVGTLHLSVNGENTSITDVYAETESLDLVWSSNVVNDMVQLQYSNGLDDKILAIDTKYFPH